MRSFKSSKILKALIMFALISGIFNDTYFCTENDKKPGPCTREYNPVCAHPFFMCLRYDCRRTYPNGCEACRDPLIKSFVHGECPPKPSSEVRNLEFLA